RAGSIRRRRPRPARPPAARVDREVGARGSVLSVIRPLVEADAQTMLDLYVRNSGFLAPYEPVRGDDFFTVEAQRVRIAEPGRHSWLIVDEGEPSGFVGLSNIVRGPLQSAVVSYWVDKGHNGRGLCTAAVAEVVDHAFGELALHRLEAGTLVDN